MIVKVVSESEVTPVTPYRDNTAELEAMIAAAPHSSSMSGWLATLGLFLVAAAFVIAPFVFAWFLLGPKIVAACVQVGMCQ